MLSFDAGSFAPFAFSPISWAIQQLIEEIQGGGVYGGGRRGARGNRAGPSLRSTRPLAQGRSRAEDVSREEVQAQWDLLEARLRGQRERQAPAAAPASKPAPAPEAAQITAALPEIHLPGVLRLRAPAHERARERVPAHDAAGLQREAATFDDDDMLAVALAFLALD